MDMRQLKWHAKKLILIESRMCLILVLSYFVNSVILNKFVAYNYPPLYISHLTCFFVSDNEFTCDCRIAWLHKLRKETKSHVIRETLDNLRCYLDDGNEIAPSISQLSTKSQLPAIKPSEFSKQGNYDASEDYSDDDYTYNENEDYDQHDIQNNQVSYQ